MTAEEIKNIISTGENLTTEFKDCINEVSGSVYETICSFLNHSGGNILLGVNDNGEIIGVNKKNASQLVKTIINTVNNPELFTPRTAVYPEIILVDEKVVIYIYVHSSPSVHQYKKKFYDRNGDADPDVSQDFGLLANLFSRKTAYSSERRSIPFLKIEDLDSQTFDLCRKLIVITRPTHPWLTMNDKDILTSARLIDKNPVSGQEEINLAGLLLFGTESSIMQYWPMYRIEAIFRNKTYSYHLKNDVKDTTRYDDRVTERRNLIQAYYTLSEFVERHLPDKFYLEDGNPQRQDLRTNIFREVIANLLVHREYSNPSPGTFEIFSDRVVVTNWSKPALGEKSGIVSIDELHTYTKNPLIVQVFRQLGWIEELGSGFRNIKKYAPEYYTHSTIEIQNSERFIFSMTYQNTDDELFPSDSISVNKSEIIKSNDVNKSKNSNNKSTEKECSVNGCEIDCYTLAKSIITEFVSGISDKIIDRMSEEMAAIYSAKQLTKNELKEKLGLSEEQVKIDLKELTRNKLLEQKGKEKKYMLSEKSITKISLLQK